MTPSSSSTDCTVASQSLPSSTMTSSSQSSLYNFLGLSLDAHQQTLQNPPLWVYNSDFPMNTDSNTHPQDFTNSQYQGSAPPNYVHNSSYRFPSKFSHGPPNAGHLPYYDNILATQPKQYSDYSLKTRLQVDEHQISQPDSTQPKLEGKHSIKLF